MEKFILVFQVLIVVFVVLEIYIFIMEYPKVYIRDEDGNYLTEDMQSSTNKISKAISYHALNPKKNKALKLASSLYPKRNFSLKKMVKMETKDTINNERNLDKVE